MYDRKRSSCIHDPRYGGRAAGKQVERVEGFGGCDGRVGTYYLGRYAFLALLGRPTYLDR